MYLFIALCICAMVCSCQGLSVENKRSWLSIWVLEIELRTLGLTGSDLCLISHFTHYGIYRLKYQELKKKGTQLPYFIFS